MVSFLVEKAKTNLKRYGHVDMKDAKQAGATFVDYDSNLHCWHQIVVRKHVPTSHIVKRCSVIGGNEKLLTK